MSIQWTFIAGYLYFEVALVIIMILPIFSPRWWHVFFKSRIFSKLREHASVYFYIFLGALSLFLVDAVREMNKYSHSSDLIRTHLMDEMKLHVKLFRAQRNFYITGFAIFLTFVIRRLVTMLIIQDELSLKAEKIIKEAEATVKHAKMTVLANTLQRNEIQENENIKNKLEITEIMLTEERELVKGLKEEADKWRLKYEELSNSHGKGDE